VLLLVVFLIILTIPLLILPLRLITLLALVSCSVRVLTDILTALSKFLCLTLKVYLSSSLSDTVPYPSPLSTALPCFPASVCC
jgi:hypothetical protein